MRTFYKIVLANVLLLLSINSFAAYRCVVADGHDRTWTVKGPRACRIAIQRCHAWHMARRGNVGNCQVVRKR